MHSQHYIMYMRSELYLLLGLVYGLGWHAAFRGARVLVSYDTVTVVIFYVLYRAIY